MADNREPTESTALDRLIRGVIGGMWFCRPGYIEKFDAKTQLAEVTPAITMKKSVDGKVEYLKHKPLVKVPVVAPYAQTLGLAVTLPIHTGDECLLIFCDRFTDDFVEKGAQQGNARPERRSGDNKTSEPRLHHMTDAFCIPGIISQPKVLPDWNSEAIEIRNKERTCFFSMNKNCNITVQTSGNVYTYCNNAVVSAMGSLDISANGAVNINPPSAASVTSTGKGCCSGSCSSTYKDSCCGATPSGKMCCGGAGGACSSGACTGTMKAKPFKDGLGKLCVRN